jgi:Uncharacterized conserved protein
MISSGSLNHEGPVLSRQFARKLIVQLGAFVSITIVCLALWVLYHTLEEIHLSDVIQHLRDLSAPSIILAFAITATSYFVVTGYDVLALHHIYRPLPYPRAALASFLASAFGNNIGFGLITGGSMRYRIYSSVGLSALEIAGVTTLCSLTTILGMGFIFALSMLLGTGELIQSVIPLPSELRRTVGSIMMVLMVVYLTFTAIRPIEIHTRSWSFRLPSAKVMSAQITLATIDLMLVAALIYVLLPTHAGTNFFAFLGVFALAMMAGAMSNVPGGIGVFETVLLLGLPRIPPAALLGSVLLFRCIYYLTPLSLAALLLVAYEFSVQHAWLVRLRDTAADWLIEFTPQALSALVIFAGAVLLFSGAIPVRGDRLGLLQGFVPLPLLEGFHVIGSATGLGLIILARGLSRRLHTAYHLTLILLGIGIAASLLKGLDYEQAIIHGIILIAIWFSRPEFQRKDSLFSQGFTVQWVSALTVILALTIWLGLFSYKNIGYSNELWWQFAFDADFSRFLRSMFVVFALAGGVMLVNLLRPDPIPDLPHAADLEQVRRIIKRGLNTRANLALLGDKRLLFSDSGNAFIMYRVRGRSWVALGDPIGPADERERLLWTFRELCDHYGGWPIFYLVDAEGLSLYIDLGLSLLKLGDEARVPLEMFSLGGTTRTELRKVYDQLLEQGVSFEIVNSPQVPPLIPELKRVSNAWLAVTKMCEKSFSMGFFNPEYIARLPCAVVRKDGRIVAFAILWATANKEELALDLMRYHPEAPKGVIDYLIVELMLGGQARGYRWFNLGIAPLASVEAHPLTPLWHRIGGLIYRQSEHFHNIESLRRYEEQFRPVWRPKYLASPGGLSVAQILRDISKLIARGKK